MERTPYEILGLERGCSDEDVRKAFRELAQKHHPDRNPGDAGAVERFKEVNSAFQILSDPQKRASLDGIGFRSGPGDPFGGISFDDVQRSIEDMFGPMSRGRRAGGPFRNVPAPGADVTCSVVLSATEAEAGCKRLIEFRSDTPCVPCPKCGEGSPCAMCGGRRTSFMSNALCPQCMGGRRRCGSCSGGKVIHVGSVTVSIPRAITDGQVLRVRGKGTPGVPPGDLYVEVRVEKTSAVVERVPMSLLAGGGRISLSVGSKTFDVDVQPGTQSGTAYRLDGVDVVLQARVPAGLTPRAAKLLAELDEELERTGLLR